MVEHYEEDCPNTTDEVGEACQKCFREKELQGSAGVEAENSKRETLNIHTITSEIRASEVDLIDSGNGYYY